MLEQQAIIFEILTGALHAHPSLPMEARMNSTAATMLKTTVTMSSTRVRKPVRKGQFVRTPRIRPRQTAMAAAKYAYSTACRLRTAEEYLCCIRHAAYMAIASIGKAPCKSRQCLLMLPWRLWVGNTYCPVVLSCGLEEGALAVILFM